MSSQTSITSKIDFMLSHHSNKITLVLLSASILLLIHACVLRSVWWPCMNVLFLFIGAIPAIFGSLRSNGVWGALGDFTIGCMLVSIFAFPTVLHNSHIIHNKEFISLIFSDIFVTMAVFLNIVKLHGE
jgi:hypothetical protein